VIQCTVIHLKKERKKERKKLQITVQDILQNVYKHCSYVSTLLPGYTVSHPRRQ